MLKRLESNAAVVFEVRCRDHYMEKKSNSFVRQKVLDLTIKLALKTLIERYSKGLLMLQKQLH